MSTVPHLAPAINPGTIPLNLAVADYDDAAFLDLARTGFRGDNPVDGILTMHAWVRIQADAIRRKGSPTARWLAGQLDELAAMVERLKAETPEDFDARMELEEEARITTAWDQGWEACRRRQQTQLDLDWEVR